MFAATLRARSIRTACGELVEPRASPRARPSTGSGRACVRIRWTRHARDRRRVVSGVRGNCSPRLRSELHIRPRVENGGRGESRRARSARVRSGVAARSIARVRVRAAPVARRVRLVDRTHRRAGHDHVPARPGLWTYGHAAHGGRIPRRGRSLLHRRAGAGAG